MEATTPPMMRRIPTTRRSCKLSSVASIFKEAHCLTLSRHHLWLLTLDDKLFLAPIENPQLVLDVGTGTGLWAV